MSTTTVKQNVSKIDYEVRRGDTFTAALTYKDSDGLVLDMTTYTARLDVKDEIDGSIIKSISQTDGITLTNTSPNISIAINHTDTEAFTFGNAVYDLELIDAAGTVKTLIEGVMKLKLDVTI